MCTFEIMCTLLCTDCTVYGTVSAVSALVMSAVVGAICTAMYICTSDVNIKVRCTFWLYKHQNVVNSLLGKIESTHIELEQNSAYQGIKTFPSSLTGEDMEPSPAYGIVL